MLYQNTRYRLHWHGLSKGDTLILKAVGIILIVLHNYFHLMPNWTIENEFSFNKENFLNFRSGLSNNLYNNIGLFFSYYGHYGVQLFVFLSGYGLYESHQNKQIEYWPFVWQRILKLWPVFFLAVMFFLSFTIIQTGSFDQGTLYVRSVLRLTFLSNLVPGQALSVVGPWWFYSMIVQFYLLFPLMRKWFNRYGIAPLLAMCIVCWISIYFFLDVFEAMRINLITLVVGHIPVFSLGMVAARYKDRIMPLWPLLLAATIFFLASLYKEAWLFSRLSVTILFIYTYIFLKSLLQHRQLPLSQSLLFVGNISMYIFAVNGFLRPPFIELAAQYAHNSPLKFVVAFLFIVVVFVVALLLRQTEKYARRLFKPALMKLPGYTKELST